MFGNNALSNFLEDAPLDTVESLITQIKSPKLLVVCGIQMSAPQERRDDRAQTVFDIVEGLYLNDTWENTQIIISGGKTKPMNSNSSAPEISESQAIFDSLDEYSNRSGKPFHFQPYSLNNEDERTNPEIAMQNNELIIPVGIEENALSTIDNFRLIRPAVENFLQKNKETKSNIIVIGGKVKPALFRIETIFEDLNKDLINDYKPRVRAIAPFNEQDASQYLRFINALKNEGPMEALQELVLIEKLFDYLYKLGLSNVGQQLTNKRG